MGLPITTPRLRMAKDELQKWRYSVLLPFPSINSENSMTENLLLDEEDSTGCSRSELNEVGFTRNLYTDE
jgi:hypothetical protein